MQLNTKDSLSQRFVGSLERANFTKCLSEGLMAIYVLNILFVESQKVLIMTNKDMESFMSGVST